MKPPRDISAWVAILALAASLLGVVVTVSARASSLETTVRQHGEELKEARAARDKYLEYIRSVDMRLSRIEGAVGVEQ